jgi:hypothetical protein
MPSHLETLPYTKTPILTAQEYWEVSGLILKHGEFKVAILVTSASQMWAGMMPPIPITQRPIYYNHDCVNRVNEGCLENYETCPQTPNLFFIFPWKWKFFHKQPKKRDFFFGLPIMCVHTFYCAKFQMMCCVANTLIKTPSHINVHTSLIMNLSSKVLGPT